MGREAAPGAVVLDGALWVTPAPALWLTALDISIVPRERIGMLAATVVGVARSTGGAMETGATVAVAPSDP